KTCSPVRPLYARRNAGTNRAAGRRDRRRRTDALAGRWLPPQAPACCRATRRHGRRTARRRRRRGRRPRLSRRRTGRAGRPGAWGGVRGGGGGGGLPGGEPPVTVCRQAIPVLRLARGPGHRQPADVLRRSQTEDVTAVARRGVTAAALGEARQPPAAHLQREPG